MRPEAALVKPADAEERAVPAALLEFLGEAPTSVVACQLRVAADQAPSAAALRCHQPATRLRVSQRSSSSCFHAYILWLQAVQTMLRPDTPDSGRGRRDNRPSSILKHMACQVLGGTGRGVKTNADDFGLNSLNHHQSTISHNDWNANLQVGS